MRRGFAIKTAPPSWKYFVHISSASNYSLDTHMRKDGGSIA
jgi:hypothetical protein